MATFVPGNSGPIFIIQGSRESCDGAFLVLLQDRVGRAEDLSVTQHHFGAVLSPTDRIHILLNFGRTIGACIPIPQIRYHTPRFCTIHSEP